MDRQHDTVRQRTHQNIFAGLRGIIPNCKSNWRRTDFLGLTRECTEIERNALRCGSPSTFRPAAGSLFVGSLRPGVLLGITLPIVRVAGGLVVAVTGWQLLQAGYEEERAGHRRSSPQMGFIP